MNARSAPARRAAPPVERAPLAVAAAQFEMIQADKRRNGDAMERLVERAAAAGARVVAFPEACLTGYHFLTGLDRARLRRLAERTDDGPAIERFARAARRHGVVVLFGLVERAGDALFNTYVAVGPQGRVFQHRKIHAFENSAIEAGDRLEVFALDGWTCGALVCYDNNLPENHRVLALQGAELVFAPHQTGGFDIERAGMGRIPLALWWARREDPVAIRDAFLGPKGRAWIHKWLPSRAYDNNTFMVFVNGVGIDGPEVRVGCSAILDPEGLVLAETAAAGEDVVVARLHPQRRVGSLPSIHLASRRPSLYGRLAEAAAEIDTRVLRNRVSGEQIA